LGLLLGSSSNISCGLRGLYFKKPQLLIDDIEAIICVGEVLSDLYTEVTKMLYVLLAIISLLVAAGSLYQYVQTASTFYIVLTFFFLAAGVVLGAVYFSGRVNKTEDIHITE